MRILPRAAVMSVASLAMAVGWVSAPGAAAGPAEPAAARHIVVLHDDADSDAVARDHGRRHGAQVENVYHHALKGYVAVLKGKAAADIARDPRVDFVELDGAVSVHSDADRSQQRGVGPRPDRRPRALPSTTPSTTPSSGAGVTAYIIDTGIQYTPHAVRRAGRQRR